METATSAIEDVVWAAAYGTATPEQLNELQERPTLARDALNRLIDATEDALESARELPMSIRQQVVTDFEDDLERLETMYELVGSDNGGVAGEAVDPIGQVRLQLSWHGNKVVVWAAGPTTQPDDLDGVRRRLEAVGCPTRGWAEHQPVPLPSGIKAPALSNSVADALGWLVAVGGGQGRDAVGTSVAWMGRVAVNAVRIVAEGNIVPSLDTDKINEGKALECHVRWIPALLANGDIDELAAAMPGPVTALGRVDPRRVTLDLLRNVVDAIVTTAARQTELPAPPPQTRNTSQVAEAVLTRLDGTRFETPVATGAEISKRLQRWAKPATGTNRPTLVVQLDPPDSGDAWFLQVLGKGAEGNYLPIEVALADSKNTKPLADELQRVERVLPALMRPGGKRRGQVYLDQSEAWELMTVTGPALAKCGFDIRLPKLSRRKPRPSLRLFADAEGQSVVGAHQLANVRWSAVFGDVELTAEEIQRLVHEAKPLVQSNGRWVELDRADLKEAAAALAERAEKKQMTGAELLRHAVGLEENPLFGGIEIGGSNWASDILASAQSATTAPVAEPEGFRGTLRNYQAEAVGWLDFLDRAELSGCLALDMGLGKTPTVLAQIARTAPEGPALVVAPPAVVGNWAAEARKFTPTLRVYVHHGARREEGAALQRRIGKVDLVISTYGTAVRDVDALEQVEWRRVVLDEAQAIKNPANDTSKQLRRIPSRSRIALTGTPIENGLGDLWAILDYCNPGLLGSRNAFIGQMSGEGDAALRALNGILVFRRTKSEPGVAEELPDKIDELDHCSMTPEQIGLYQAVIDQLTAPKEAGAEVKQGEILAAITKLKQICNHPAAYTKDDKPLAGRSGKLTRLEEIVDHVFEAEEKLLIFTHFAEWGRILAKYLTDRFGVKIESYDGSLARGARDRIIEEFQGSEGRGALVLSLKAGGTGLNLTAASHVVLYDRWWNPAVEDQARDRAWRIGQTRTVVSHRLVCPGTVDERVEEVVAGKRHIANLVLPKSSSLADLDASQLRVALGLAEDELMTDEDEDHIDEERG